MFNLVYPIYGKIITEHGIFHSTKNSKGVVRDHAYSRRSGFDNSVFPEILRHPENCQIILHRDNVVKQQCKSVDSDSISIEELFDKIQKTQYNWIEQEKCIRLIREYNNGARWERKTIDKSP
jgi:hypothetical protein